MRIIIVRLALERLADVTRNAGEKEEYSDDKISNMALDFPLVNPPGGVTRVEPMHSIDHKDATQNENRNECFNKQAMVVIPGILHHAVRGHHLYDVKAQGAH